MLSVLGYMRLPNVFEVMVVGHGAASLDLRDHPLARADPVVEVWSGP